MAFDDLFSAFRMLYHDTFMKDMPLIVVQLILSARIEVLDLRSDLGYRIHSDRSERYEKQKILLSLSFFANKM